MVVTIILILCGAILLTELNYLIAKEFAFIAREKGYPQKRYFWWVFLTGLLGIIMVIALPNKGTAAGAGNKKNIINDELPEL